MKKGLSYIAYALSYTFWYTMSLLPMSLLYVFSDCLYLLVGKVVKYRHKVIWKNLKDSFPEKDEAELQRIEHGFYHYFCDYLVETIKLLNMSKRELRQRMVFTGIEEMCLRARPPARSPHALLSLGVVDLEARPGPPDPPAPSKPVVQGR